MRYQLIAIAAAATAVYAADPQPASYAAPPAYPQVPSMKVCISFSSD